MRSGFRYLTNADRVDTGDGADEVSVQGVPTPGFTLDLGAGSNTLAVYFLTEDPLRLALGSMPTLHPQPGETVLGWNGTASQVLLSGGPATGGSIRFQGADADEAVVLTPYEPGLTLSVDLGRGDDTLDDW